MLNELAERDGVGYFSWEQKINYYWACARLSTNKKKKVPKLSSE